MDGECGVRVIRQTAAAGRSGWLPPDFEHTWGKSDMTNRELATGPATVDEGHRPVRPIQEFTFTNGRDELSDDG